MGTGPGLKVLRHARCPPVVAVRHWLPTTPGLEERSVPLSEDEQHGGDHGCHVHGYPTQSVGVVVLNGGAEKEEERAKPRRPADETDHLLPPRKVVVKTRRLVRPAAG